MTNITRIDHEAHVQSPFLSETLIQFAWDSTSLGYLKTCPRLYQYNMIDGWAPKDDNIHLRFGIEYHSALQEYDILSHAGKSHDDACAEVLEGLLIRTFDWKVDETHRPGKYKNRTSLIRTVQWYLDEHKDDKAKTFILQDNTPAVELSFRFELDFGPAREERMSMDGRHTTSTQPYLLTGHLDRVVRLLDELYVMDHKTTTSTPGPYFFNGFEPNNQMTLYTLASQVILQAPVKGVIINAAQLLIGGSKFVRGFTFRTKDQLDEWIKDLRYWFTLAESFAVNNYWPMNDTACDKFGGCKFREICSKSPTVRKNFLKSKFVQLDLEARWNPLRPR